MFLCKPAAGRYSVISRGRFVLRMAAFSWIDKENAASVLVPSSSSAGVVLYHAASPLEACSRTRWMPLCMIYMSSVFCRSAKVPKNFLNNLRNVACVKTRPM